MGRNPRKPEKEERRQPDPSEPLSAIVFKVIADEHAEIFYLRLYSGVLKANSRVYNPGKDSKEVIAKLFHVHADPKQREDLAEAYAGDIVATVGLKEAVTGDTLCETQHPILLEPIVFAEAVVSQSIEPESSGDKQKLFDTLLKLRREDPTFTYEFNSDTGQTLMSGMGTLHLEVKRHRMERDFKVKVKARSPRVSYRETMRQGITVTGECDKQLATTQLIAKLTVKFTVGGDDPIIKVTNQVKPTVLPPLLAAAAERGLRGALGSGEMSFPLLFVQAVILDAQVDPQFSTETAFEIAATNAVNQAQKDNSILLEPIMKTRVTVPEEFVGNVIGDLQARRASIERLDAMGRYTEIDALVPLAKMFDYADKVRSLSQGRAGSTMEPHSYGPAPDEVVRAFTEGTM